MSLDFLPRYFLICRLYISFLIVFFSGFFLCFVWSVFRKIPPPPAHPTTQTPKKTGQNMKKNERKMIIIIIMMVMIIMREKQNKQTDKSYFKKNYKKQMNVALCRFCTASIPSLRSRHFPNQLTNPNSIRPESSNSQTRFPSPRPTHPLLPHPVGSSLNVCFVIGQ